MHGPPSGDHTAKPAAPVAVDGGHHAVFGDELAPFRALSARLGRAPHLIQGPGGNTSLKREGRLLIKASGTSLADAEARSIFLSLDLAETMRRCHEAAEPDWEGLVGPGLGHPSMETPLHVLLPHAVVLHVHAISAIASAVLADGRERLEARLAGLPWAWVPYARPGGPLTRSVAQVLAGSASPPPILILENHGVVVAGDSSAEAEARLAEVERRLMIPARPLPGPPPGPFRAWARQSGWRLPDAAVIHALALDPTALAVARRGVLYPDHVVFLGPGLPELSQEEIDTVPDAPAVAASRWAQANGFPAQYLVVPDQGVLVAREAPGVVEAMLGCLSRVARRIEDPEAVRPLSPGDVAALLESDAERYRHALSRERGDG